MATTDVFLREVEAMNVRLRDAGYIANHPVAILELVERVYPWVATEVYVHRQDLARLDEWIAKLGEIRTFLAPENEESLLWKGSGIRPTPCGHPGCADADGHIDACLIAEDA